MSQDGIQHRQPKGSALSAPVEQAASYDASGKSPDEIERDIGDTRAQLGALLDELERKLGPRHLLERGVDMVRDSMTGNGGKIGETLRNHPIPVALIGVGIGWMLLSNTSRSSTGDPVGALRECVSGRVGDMADRAGALAGQIKDKVASAVSPSPYSTEAAGQAYGRPKSGIAESGVAGMAGGVARQAREMGSTVAQRSGEYAEQAGDWLETARDRFTQLMDEHPLAMGALGLVAGAAIGFMLPATRTEERWMGPVRERVRDQAASMGREAVERAQRTVDTAVGAVKDAVNETADAMAGKGEEKKP